LSDEEVKEIRPFCRERFQEFERDMLGVPGDEYGMRRKVGVLWTAHLKRKETEIIKKVAWDKVLHIGLAALQSGLLVYVISGRKVS